MDRPEVNKSGYKKYQLSSDDVEKLNLALSRLWWYEPNSPSAGLPESSKSEESPYSTDTEKKDIEYMRENKLTREEFDRLKNEQKRREREVEFTKTDNTEVRKDNRMSVDSGCATDDGATPYPSPHGLVREVDEEKYEASTEDSTPVKTPVVKKSKIEKKKNIAARKEREKKLETRGIVKSPSSPQLSLSEDKSGLEKGCKNPIGSKRKLY